MSQCFTTVETNSSVASPKFSPSMQISNYHFTVNEHKKICIEGLNIRAGYATGNKLTLSVDKFYHYNFKVSNIKTVLLYKIYTACAANLQYIDKNRSMDKFSVCSSMH